MSSWAVMASLAGITIRKRENVLEPFKRTMALADAVHDDAVKKLNEAVKELETLCPPEKHDEH